MFFLVCVKFYVHRELTHEIKKTSSNHTPVNLPNISFFMLHLKKMGIERLQ